MKNAAGWADSFLLVYFKELFSSEHKITESAAGTHNYFSSRRKYDLQEQFFLDLYHSGLLQTTVILQSLINP